MRNKALSKEESDEFDSYGMAANLLLLDALLNRAALLAISLRLPRETFFERSDGAFTVVTEAHKKLQHQIRATHPDFTLPVQAEQPSGVGGSFQEVADPVVELDSPAHPEVCPGCGSKQWKRVRGGWICENSHGF